MDDAPEEAALVEAQEATSQPEPPGKWEKMSEREHRGHAREWRSRRTENFPGGFGDSAILHARGAGGFAGAAHETQIQVLAESLVGFDPAFGGGVH